MTAINIIGHSEFESIADAECVYNLLKLAGTEESVGKESLDDYAVQRIIGWLQQQKGIDLELRSDIEFIYLPILNDYSEVQPLALRTMAVIDLLSILPSVTLLNNSLKLLKLFRLFRTFRVLRVFKVIRYSKSINIIINVFKKQRETFMVVGGLAIGCILVSALVVFNVEPETFS